MKKNILRIISLSIVTALLLFNISISILNNSDKKAYEFKVKEAKAEVPIEGAEDCYCIKPRGEEGCKVWDDHTCERGIMCIEA